MDSVNLFLYVILTWGNGEEYNIMRKKIIPVILSVVLLAIAGGVGVWFFTPKTTTPEIEKPYDVPKVLIYTNGEEIVTETYTNCEIIIVDETDGEFTTIRDAASTIKIRGNSTSAGHKKPYNIKFSAKTDVLGMGANKKWTLLANCFEKTLIRNQVVFDVDRKSVV